MSITQGTKRQEGLNSGPLLVFPAASKPNISNLISLLPNMRPKSGHHETEVRFHGSVFE